MLVEHTVQLKGKSIGGGRPTPEAAASVLRLIEPLVEEAVSLGFRRPSHARGRKPEWLRAACDVRYVNLSAGPDDSTIFHFEAPRLGEAAPEVYKQRELFRLRPDPTDTGFDLLGDTLLDILNQARDSERYDPRLLRNIGRFKTMSPREGVDSLTLLGDRIPVDPPPMLDVTVADLANGLHRQTPAPRRAKVAGKLDMIRDSDNVFVVCLDDGAFLRGVWTGGEMTTLSPYFGQYILIEGQAIFRPSGRVLRLDADTIKLAGDGDKFFSTLPLPMATELDTARLRQPQTPGTGAGAIFGKWPGDETEAELLAALKELG